MATAIAKLPDQQAASLQRVYAKAVLVRRLRAGGVAVVILTLTMLSAYIVDVRPATFFGNIGNFGRYIHAILPSLSLGDFFGDLKAWYWDFGGWLKLLAETILIAYLGTLMGAACAFCLCFLASANLVRTPAIRNLARRFLEICRTVPTIVFALIFVIAFGIGPMAGVLALTIHTTGALGKLFAEVVENIEMKPVEGLTAAGATWIQTVRFAVVPQILPGFASYSLLRFEINVREAGVMGFVGAGGIGQEFLVAIRNFYYSDVSAILLMIVATVVTIDLVTEQIRHRLIGLGGTQ